MRLPVRLSIATLACSTLALVAGPVVANAATPASTPHSAATLHSAATPHLAATSHSSWLGSGHNVFVQTDLSTGNQVEVFAQGSDGRLSQTGTYATGGDGGIESGAVVDSLASQNSLVYDHNTRTLYAVNAGSNTISAFFVAGDHLIRTEVLPSGGQFPVSIAVKGNLLYVLNAGGAGSVQGYAAFGPFLFPLPWAQSSLGLDNTTPPNYLMGPGDIGFTPNGRQLIVTTKDSTSDIDVFQVGRLGKLSAPIMNASATPVPFAFTFSSSGSLVVAEAGASTVSTYAVNSDGTLTHQSSLADGQTALCWITPASGFDYVANAGSANLSAYSVGAGGSLSLVGSTGVVAATGAGPIDMAASPNGKFLYSEQGGAGAIGEFAVNSNGSLSSLGTVAGLNPGLEGIATN
jgi:6-phosphogluconolactonase (cycloisomerase 2 family)